MADAGEKEILTKIKDTYVPFLKKFITFLENKKTTPANLNKVKAIYTIFTTAPPAEQVETFHANKKKLEDWYNKADKKKRGNDAGDEDASETAQPPAKKRSANSKEENHKAAENNSTSAEEPLVFACASCQFSSGVEEEFIKHARTDHRSELSMWCKQCEKCFSNASLLVTHIKNRNCVKEDMVYVCGAKDCPFQTGSGQTFVHHLRHNHKGFLFCIHCQKYFTLPHCLILHMQDECQFKERFRKSGVCATPPVQATPAPAAFAPAAPAIRPPAPASVRPSTTSRRGRASGAPTRAPLSLMPSTTSRGRGRGRGRGRSNDVDIEDVDDPAYRAKTSVADTNLRRSSRRAAKKDDEDVVDSDS